MQRIVMLPIFNEVHTIRQVLAGLELVADQFIIVNDGSTDATEAELAPRLRQHPDVIYISLPHNRGMATALKHGMWAVIDLMKRGEIAEDDVIIHFDADGQHVPDYIVSTSHFLQEHRYDMVLLRRSFDGLTFKKKYGNLFLTWIAGLMSGFPFKDIECGYRFMRAGIIPDLMRYYSGFRYSCAQEFGIITSRRGYRVHNERPVDIPFYRQRGTGVKDGFGVLSFSIIALLRAQLGWARRRPFPVLRAIDSEVARYELTLNQTAVVSTLERSEVNARRTDQPAPLSRSSIHS